MLGCAIEEQCEVAVSAVDRRGCKRRLSVGWTSVGVVGRLEQFNRALLNDEMNK